MQEELMIPMAKNIAIKKIQCQIALIDSININEPFSPQFNDWRKNTEKLLTDIFINDCNQKNDFIKISFKRTGVYFLSTNPNDDSRIKYFNDGLAKAKILLESFIKEIEENWKDDTIITNDKAQININDVVELKPNFMGFGININAIIKKYFKKNK
jgi:hypothetical protein